MNTFAERMALAIQRVKERHKELTEEKIARQLLGVSRVSVYKWKRGIVKDLKVANLRALAQRANVHEAWLLSGIQPMARDEPITEIAEEVIAYNMNPMEQALVKYFRELTPDQQSDVIAQCQNQGLRNREIFEELGRRNAS